jgi:hypothetical protein
MTLADQIASDLGNLFSPTSGLAQDLTFTRVDTGESFQVSGVFWEPASFNTEIGIVGIESEKRVATLCILKTALASALASRTVQEPWQGDIVKEASNREWKIRVFRDDRIAQTWTIELLSAKVKSHSGPGTRQQQ